MTAAAAVSNLVHFDTTPRMVRAAHALHARSCAQFAARRAEQEARSASWLVSVSTTCTNHFVLQKQKNVVQFWKKELQRWTST